MQDPIYDVHCALVVDGLASATESESKLRILSFAPSFGFSLTSLKLFYASQIALQSALVIVQIFQASIGTRVLAVLRRRSGYICIILTVVLGVCAIVLVCIPPSVNVGSPAHAVAPTRLTALTRLAYIAGYV
jgi:hypothetical protein